MRTTEFTPREIATVIRESGNGLMADLLEHLLDENEALRKDVRRLITRLDGVTEHLGATTEELDSLKAGQRLHPVVAHALSPFAPAA